MARSTAGTVGGAPPGHPAGEPAARPVITTCAGTAQFHNRLGRLLEGHRRAIGAVSDGASPRGRPPGTGLRAHCSPGADPGATHLPGVRMSGSDRNGRWSRRRSRRIAPPVWLALLLLAAPAAARDDAPVHARAGLDLARAAAAAWSPDAVLVCVENDEPIDSHGASARWAFLFSSAERGASRVYSVRGGRIVHAEDVALEFEAPPITDDWMDSPAAHRAVDEGPARRFAFENDARLDTMLLLRGAGAPDGSPRTTWLFVYRAPNHPALFVVLDAADGRVLRTWRS